MEKTNYHHGNLRWELIQAGIQIIDEEGVEHLSLRKAAMMCGVSHAAPKNHFKDKEEFEEAIKEYIADEFTSYYEKVVEETEDPKLLIRNLGRAYIQFFQDNPQCFRLLINQKDINIRMSATAIEECNYKPFEIFRTQATAVMCKSGVPKEEIPQRIITLWAMVNGLAGMQVMKGFHYEGDWMEMVNRIIY